MATAASSPTLDVVPKTSHTRRIVKASVPQPITDNLSNSSLVDEKTEIDEIEKKERFARHPYTLNDSPIRRELVKEDADSTRMKRIESAKEHQHAKREKLLQERRLNPKSPSETPKANPFSQFIRAFSVAPKHPEHKRAFDKTPSDKEILEPLEKRLRPSESQMDESHGEFDEPFDESVDGDEENQIITIPAMVTAFAVAALILFAWKRR